MNDGIFDRNVLSLCRCFQLRIYNNVYWDGAENGNVWE